MSFYPQNNNPAYPYSSPIGVPAVNINSVMKMVYTWMALGLLVTAGVAWFTATNEALASLRGNSVVMIISIVVLFGSVIGLSAGINRLSPGIAAALFLTVAGINGFSLSLLLEYFVRNEPGALYAAFGTSAALFGTMSVIGYTTKADLTSWGTYLFAGLIGIILATVINWFIGSSALAFLISVGGVIVFTALTAYDTQKIKEMSEHVQMQGDGNLAVKLSVLGALTLYLDFLNLFLFLLQIFGGSRD
jgi:uncharacterized protein